jgi:integrase
MVLGPTKTVSTQGTVILPPTVVTLLRARQLDQERQRAESGLAWATASYEGENLQLVFTDWRGRPLLYQRLHDAVRDCCEAAGIDPKGVATHAGRRSVITALYGAGLDLSDIARFVGHTQTSTTAGYVHHLGERPRITADLAAKLLDPGGS